MRIRNAGALGILVAVTTALIPSVAHAQDASRTFQLGQQRIHVWFSTSSGETLDAPLIIGDAVQDFFNVTSGSTICNNSFEFHIFRESQQDALTIVPSLMTSSTIESPGNYYGEFVGTASCFDPVTHSWVPFSIDEKWPVFTAVDAITPRPILPKTMRCSPAFKISVTREISYKCLITVRDPDHVADLIGVNPAIGTPLSPGATERTIDSKNWKKIATGWQISTSFTLLTVSPYDYARLRSTERFSINVWVQDNVIDKIRIFNRGAPDGLPNGFYGFVGFVFPYKK